MDLQLGTLRKNGSRIRCQEQPLQVLAALAERPGELVTRDELRRRVWPQDTFVDFDHALNTAVKKIRAALNDDPEFPRYIETVPRRGYRFIAPIKQGGISPVLNPPPAAIRRPRLLILAMSAVILALLGSAWKLGYFSHRETPAAPEFHRLTFNHAELGYARFTPDGASVVYSVGGHFEKADIFIQRLGAPSPQSLGIADAALLAVSRQGELAVVREDAKAPFDEMYYRESTGTLAQASLGGSAPRELLRDVEAADWSPDGQLAVVRRVGQRSRLEFPIGKVLYETTGWIASPRFSPSGGFIAFLDHPVVPDDRGGVAVVDLKGAKSTLSGFWESLRGLAWSPRGDEIWFTAARSGVSRVLYAVTLDGRQRRVLSIAGGASLCDISRDGRILLTRDNERLGVMFKGRGEKEPRDLSWKDWSIAMDISRDGKTILFDEEGEDSGFSYQVALRPTDGSPPVILGSGMAQSLSPDGQWALSIMPAPNDQIVLLPTRAGTARTLPGTSVDHYESFGAGWFPDSKQITFVGYEPGLGSRCYVQSIEGGAPRAFTPDGMLLCSVSPAGTILALNEDFHASLYESASSEKPVKEFGLEPGEIPDGWTLDGRFLYLFESQQKPASIVRLEIATGHRQLWKELPVASPNTELKVSVIAPDGQSYAYTYCSHFSDLYLVQGLKSPM